MPSEPAAFNLVKKIASEHGIEVDWVHPGELQMMLRRADEALEQKRRPGHKGDVRETRSGQDLQGLIHNVVLDAHVRTAASIAAEEGLTLRSVNGQNRKYALYWAGRLETARSTQEPEANCKELRIEVVKALRGRGEHPNTVAKHRLLRANANT